jgi:hypothetical protein
MPTVVYECGGAELREAGGETFSTIVKDGLLVVKADGNTITIEVDGNAVDWVPDAHQGPFKRVDTRSFMLATRDLMAFNYITLPKGLPESKYEHFDAVLAAVRDGKPIPVAAPLSAPATAATGSGAEPPAGTAGTADATKPGNPFGGLMSAIAQKAAHDTLMLGDMIKQKAAHDMQSMQGTHQKPA